MSQQSNGGCFGRAMVTRYSPEATPQKKEDDVETTEPCSVEETSEEE